MDSLDAGDYLDSRETALSSRARELCGGGERYARWLRVVERDICRACVAVAHHPGILRTIEVRIQNDPLDNTSSASMWAGVRYLADGLALQYGMRVTPIRLPDAVLFRIAANPAVAAPGPEQGAVRLGVWLRRRTRAALVARQQH